MKLQDFSEVWSESFDSLGQGLNLKARVLDRVDFRHDRTENYTNLTLRKMYLAKF